MRLLPIDGEGSTGAVDASILCFPVHDVIAQGCLSFLGSTNGSRSSSGSTSCMALLGAGGCALPSYLHQTIANANVGCRTSGINNDGKNDDDSTSTGKLTLHIDGVEPEADVLWAARDAFGAKEGCDGGGDESDGNVLRLHCTDGQTFLKLSLAQQQRFDIIVIDAFEACASPLAPPSSAAAVERSPEFRAPPSSFLEPDFLSLCRKCVRDDDRCSLVVVNVLGAEAQLNSVVLAFQTLAGTNAYIDDESTVVVDLSGKRGDALEVGNSVILLVCGSASVTNKAAIIAALRSSLGVIDGAYLRP